MLRKILLSLLIASLITFLIYVALRYAAIWGLYYYSEILHQRPGVSMLVADSLLPIYMFFIWPILETKLFFSFLAKFNCPIVISLKTLLLFSAIFEAAFWIGGYSFIELFGEVAFGTKEIVINFQTILGEYLFNYLISLALISASFFFLPKLRNYSPQNKFLA